MSARDRIIALLRTNPSRARRHRRAAVKSAARSKTFRLTAPCQCRSAPKPSEDWSDLEQLPDLPEAYRNWTFRIESGDPGVVLSVTEDNIPARPPRALDS
jgi:hypothetical protein